MKGDLGCGFPALVESKFPLKIWLGSNPGNTFWRFSFFHKVNLIESISHSKIFKHFVKKRIDLCLHNSYKQVII